MFLRVCIFFVLFSQMPRLSRELRMPWTHSWSGGMRLDTPDAVCVEWQHLFIHMLLGRVTLHTNSTRTNQGRTLWITQLLMSNWSSLFPHIRWCLTGLCTEKFPQEKRQQSLNVTHRFCSTSPEQVESSPCEQELGVLVAERLTQDITQT